MAKKRLTLPKRNSVTLQLQDIFKLLEIQHTQEAERLSQTLLNFLVYMVPGDKITTPWCAFEKMAPDILCITEADNKLLAENAADALDVKTIIHLPT